MEVVATTPPATAMRLTALTWVLCQVGNVSVVAASLPEQAAAARVPARAMDGFQRGRSTGNSLQRDL
jgi:hypothetical protein